MFVRVVEFPHFPECYYALPPRINLTKSLSNKIISVFTYGAENWAMKIEDQEIEEF